MKRIVSMLCLLGVILSSAVPASACSGKPHAYLATPDDGPVLAVHKEEVVNLKRQGGGTVTLVSDDERTTCTLSYAERVWTVSCTGAGQMSERQVQIYSLERCGADSNSIVFWGDFEDDEVRRLQYDKVRNYRYGV